MNEAKIQTAIERIQMFCPPEGGYIAYSGGKDSEVLLDLVRRSGIKHDAHFNFTTVDPPEVLKFIRSERPEVEWHKPELSMWQIIVKKQFPPTRLVRYCCEYLKERGGYDRRVYTGIRWEESSRRKRRRMVELCFKHKYKSFVHPIIDWTEEEVWEYIRARGLPVCSLYTEGYKRIGCVMCMMAPIKQRRKEAERFPGHYKAYLRAFGKMLEERSRCEKITQWKTAQEVMDWWLSA